MFGSVVLDVAIGMAFVFLLLSLIASVIQELMSAFMQLRAANLERGLRSLFSGDSLGAELDLVNLVYDHGLIRGLYSIPQMDSGVKRSKFNRVMDSVRLSARKWIGISPDKPLTIDVNPVLLPAYIPSRTFALAMFDILNANKEKGADAMNSIVKTLSAHENKASQALLALALDAKDDVGQFQGNLERWYNDAMDRVSGWYKRYTQRVLIVVGLLLALVFNVDSIRVARTLWLDRDARQAMVNAAQNYVKEHPAPAKTASAADQSAASNVQSSQSGAAASDQSGVQTAANGPKPEDTSLRAKLQQDVQAFDEVTTTTLLPIGWRHPFHFYENYFHSAPKDATFTAVRLLAGWIMTALAISFGAPFWFDTLNRFMVVRSTVKPQEKSKTEAAKG